jgi:Hypothetical glycosyl hydrolase family 15
MPQSLRVAIAILLASICTAAYAAPSLAASTSAGSVRFVKRTSSEFNVFTESPSLAQQQWMQTHFWRMEVFSPYFDSRTSWYPNGWVYRDLYSIYNPSSLAQEHPEWIAKDAAGNRLYIPWGCSNGSCPQYAANIASASYRKWWIEGAKSWLAKGYKGLWVDDVNMDPRVGNSSGAEVMPMDPATGKTMTTEAWRAYIAQFTEEIRSALPNAEIVHNSIWYAGGYAANGTPIRDQNPNVQREIKSADYINIERGVGDSGLTGGSGPWSLNSLLGFIDRVHADGKGVILDGFAADSVGREYSLASYFLISSGQDAVGQMSATPSAWWSGYETQLGAPQGNRYSWNGLLRRDFEGGTVLVNPPGAHTITVTLPHSYKNTSGTVVSSVTLGPASGAVLSGSNGGSATPPPTPPAEPPATPPAEPPASPPTESPATPPATPPAESPASPPVEPPATPPAPPPITPPVTTETTVTPEPVSKPIVVPTPEPPATPTSGAGSSPSGSTHAQPRSAHRGLASSPPSGHGHHKKGRTARHTRGGVLVHGRVRRASSGKLIIVVEQLRKHRWARIALTATAVNRSGEFRRLLAVPNNGRYRVSADYLGTNWTLPSRSVPRIVTVHFRRAA